MRSAHASFHVAATDPIETRTVEAGVNHASVILGERGGDVRIEIVGVLSEGPEMAAWFRRLAAAALNVADDLDQALTHVHPWDAPCTTACPAFREVTS